MKKYYLGIDGGGTKTAFMLADEKGSIVSEYTGPTCHYLQCGYEGVTKTISDGLGSIISTAGISKDDIVNTFIGCAGFGDTASDDPLIKEAAGKALSGIPFTIGNDCENALAGALDGKDGINIIAGTGSMAYGINSKKNLSMRCGGWHHLIGSDEGSGFWIAWNILKEFSRQSDGRDEKTPLYDLIKKELQIGDDDGEILARVIGEWGFDRTRVASISPLISVLYDKGDPHAIRIINEAASELADLAKALYRKLDFSEEGAAVSGTGGVFKLGSRITDPLSSILFKNGMTFTPALHSPVYGSVILAMKGY